MGSFHSIILESLGIIFYNSQLPTLRVCDSTLDTAAKFILLQNELTRPNNQFFEIQETGIVYN
jgi:hypothetical protein